MASGSAPQVVVLAGPNGAGKSTSAQRLLLGPLAVGEFVNADIIAEGLSAFGREGVAIEAGRVMLRRLRSLAAARQSFAFETTLATRSYARWLASLQAAGYEVRLVFLWLSTPELAVARVAARVATGGHDIAEDVIRRRYVRGLVNLLDLYTPLADSWCVVDNTNVDSPGTIAEGKRGEPPRVHLDAAWRRVTASQVEA